MSARGSYKLDGSDIYDTYSIIVERAIGHMDLPKRKGKTAFNYPDEDGEDEFTDATDIYFEPRDITLFCRIEANTSSSINTLLNAFKVSLIASGLRTLNLPYPTATDYEVYLRDGIKIATATKWISSKYVIRFILKFREPTPTRPS